MEKTKLMLEVEGRIGENLEAFLEREYANITSGTISSMETVGTRLGVSYATIYLWLGKFGIRRRTRSEMKLPAGFARPTKEQLEEWYLKQELSPSEILRDKLGGKVSLRAVKDWFKSYDIEMRTKSEAQLLLKKKRDANRQYKLGQANGTSLYEKDDEGSLEPAEPVKNERKTYDDIEYRREIVNSLLEEKRKTPDRLYTRDFTGKKTYSNLLDWYVRNHNCTKPRAKDLLVEDIFGIKLQPPEKRLEIILLGYTSP